MVVIAFQHQTYPVRPILAQLKRVAPSFQLVVRIAFQPYVNLESEPQRGTLTQQGAWFSWRGVARGAVRDSQK